MSKQLNVSETPVTEMNVNIIGDEQQYVEHSQDINPTDVTLLIENPLQYVQPARNEITINKFPDQDAFDSQASNLTWSDLSVIYEDNDFVDKSNMFVYFYDYDGSIAYKYNIGEFFVLEELPPLPDHSNINKICDGWNWTLKEIKDYLEECPADIHVGCTVHCGNNPKLGSSHVIFHNYDGEFLYDYTAAQFLALTELPALPDLTSINRVADGWNWTLAEITQYLYDVDGYVHVGFTMSPGNNPAVGSSMVRFYDYEGTLLYEYTAAQFLALSALPALPDRTSENLTCDGWNWTLSEITSYLNTVDGDVNVGAIYHTTDDKTHITCKPTETYPQAYICLKPTAANAVTVNWGDGTTDTWTTALQETKSHAYTGVTDSSVYDITISCSSGTYRFNTYITGTQSNNQNCIYTDIKLSNKVTSLGSSCFYNCYSLQSITIPSGVTSLESQCFSACYSLQSITIPSGFTSLGSQCFSACYSLQSISMPNNISIGDRVFSSCCQVKSITIPSNITNLDSTTFYNCHCLRSITIPNNITTLGDTCFFGCYSLKSINIPNTVTTIGMGCFNSCFALKYLTIPSNVTVLKSLFNSSKSLEYVSMPYSITLSGNSFFAYCYSLKSITLPHNITTLSSSFFEGCNSLKTVTLPSTVTALGSYCFKESNTLTHLYLPNGLNQKLDICFYNCNSLQFLIIPKLVTIIDNSCFYQCQHLKVLSMPNTITRFGSSCFTQVTDLQSMTIPSSVTSLPSGFFKDCFRYVKSISIPSTITSIGSNCFTSSANNIYTIYMHSATPPRLSSTNAITNHNKLTIYVPTGSLSAYQNASNWSSFSSKMKEYNNLSKNTTLVHENVSKNIEINTLSSYILANNNICVLNDNENIINDVNFYDYDGKLLYSYSSSEFLNMTVLPPLPDRSDDNLICDGWNWTLANIKTQINIVGGIINVGATHHTADDKTHIICEADASHPTAYICLRANTSNAVTIDWGDGSAEETWTSAQNETKSHTYIEFGIYDIAISCTSGTYSFPTYISGSSTNNSKCQYTEIKLSNKVTSVSLFCGSVYSLKYVSLPEGITIDWYAFIDCYNLSFVSIPRNATMRLQIFDNCRNILQICVPDNVVTFENNCFGYCAALQSITIPYTTTTFPASSVQCCCSLKSLNIPNNVTNVYITQCVSLKTLNVSNNTEYLKVNNCWTLESLNVPSSVKTLEISNCYLLKNLNIPNGVENLAINNCYYLKSINIPNTVTTFSESSCFVNCRSLESITIPSNVTNLDNISLSGGYALKSITIPNTVNSWSRINFTHAYLLDSLNIPNSISSINSVYMNSCFNLKSINIPDTIASNGLNSNNFYNCHSLKTITIPNSVTSFGGNCFYGCHALQSIDIPNSVTSFGSSCFQYCHALQSIDIPNGTIDLTLSCFYNCYSLRYINIPSSVTSLGSNCFYNCYSLQSITIPSDVTNIGNSCFANCNSLIKIKMKPTTPPTLANTNAIPNNTNLVIYVPTGTLTAYQSASNWSTFASKIFEED